MKVYIIFSDTPSQVSPSDVQVEGVFFSKTIANQTLEAYKTYREFIHSFLFVREFDVDDPETLRDYTR